MIRHRFAALSLIALAWGMLPAAPASAARCGGDFNAFLSAMAREATAAGISRRVIDSAFAGLTLDPKVLAFDRRQRGTFRKTFEQYAATRVVPVRINRARKLMQRHAALLSRIERQFGVPATLIMAIWTLESDNGIGDMGKRPVIRTIATLAHDCRRTELFQRELLAALQILIAAIFPCATSSAPMRGRSARRSFSRPPISSTASITTATAMSICGTACRMCSPPRPIC